MGVRIPEEIKTSKENSDNINQNRPTSECIRNQMNNIRDFIVNETIQSFNADETGINWAPKLKHQYIHQNELRAVTPGGDETGRDLRHC